MIPNPAIPPLSDADLAHIGQLAPAADAAATLQPAQQDLIHAKGWLRMLAPRSCGGAELPLPAVVRLEEAIASADGSLAWTVTLCAGAGWFAGFLAPQLATDIIGTDRVCVAGSGAPTGYADSDGDGYRISGRWDYASGAPMATHFTFNAILRKDGHALLDDAGMPRIRAFIVPAAQVEIVPTWGSIGLRATASHSYRIEGTWIGREHGFDIRPEAATSDGPLYRFPFLALAFVTLAANLSGMAGHFVVLARSAIAQRRHPLTKKILIEMPEVAAHVRRAEDELEDARSAFYTLLDLAWEQVSGGLAIGEATELATAALNLVRAARDAVDGLYPYCGLQAANGATDINRVWRDFHTATQHSLLLPLPA